MPLYGNVITSLEIEAEFDRQIADLNTQNQNEKLALSQNRLIVEWKILKSVRMDLGPVKN